MKYGHFFHDEREETATEQEKSAEQDKAYWEGKQGQKCSNNEFKYWHELGRRAQLNHH